MLKAAKLAGIMPDKVRDAVRQPPVPVALLADAIARDRRAGLTAPFAIVSAER